MAGGGPVRLGCWVWQKLSPSEGLEAVLLSCLAEVLQVGRPAGKH